MEQIEIKGFISTDYHVNEAYEALRNNLLFLEKDIKIVGITSFNKDDKKSVVSLNLAIALAKAGRKVVLIDSYFLYNITPMEENLCKTDFENLDIIISNKAIQKPTVRIDIEKSSELMEKLSQSYDYILLELPLIDDVLNVMETVKFCEGIVVMIEANTVSYQACRKYKEKLELTGIPIIGAILLGGS